MRRAATFLVTAILVLVGIGTAIGLRPIFAPEGLNTLYGMDVATVDAMTLALLQHRAVMVAVIGALLWIAAAKRRMIPSLVSLVILSKALFLAILWPVRAQAQTPMIFEAVSIVLLLIVLLLHATIARPPPKPRRKRRGKTPEAPPMDPR